MKLTWPGAVKTASRPGQKPTWAMLVFKLLRKGKTTWAGWWWICLPAGMPQLPTLRPSYGAYTWITGLPVWFDPRGVFSPVAGSMAGAEAACGAQPKASTERVSTRRSKPLTRIWGEYASCSRCRERPKAVSLHRMPRGERGVWGGAPLFRD